MGLLGFLLGREKGVASDQRADASKGRRLDIRRAGGRKVDAVEPCGFDSDSALARGCADVVAETGEVVAHEANIWPRGENTEKLLRDVKGLVAMSHAAGRDGFPWNHALTKRFLERCKKNLEKLDVEGRSIRCHMNLKVEGLTKTGKVKKFPVQGAVLFEFLRDYKKRAERFERDFYSAPEGMRGWVQGADGSPSTPDEALSSTFDWAALGGDA